MPRGDLENCRSQRFEPHKASLDPSQVEAARIVI